MVKLSSVPRALTSSQTLVRLIHVFIRVSRGITANMKLPSFFYTSALIASSTFVSVQALSITHSAASPSGVFDPIAALLAYGVNVSDRNPRSSGSGEPRPDGESPYNGCSFSVGNTTRVIQMHISLTQVCRASAQRSPCSIRVLSHCKAHLPIASWDLATGPISKLRSTRTVSFCPRALFRWLLRYFCPV